MDITLQTVLSENNPLLAAYYLCSNPVPDLEEDRVALLKILGLKGIFSIPYQSLYKASSSFNAYYPLPDVLKLLTRFDGSKPYTEQINQSDLTTEQKMLLHFILPV